MDELIDDLDAGFLDPIDLFKSLNFSVTKHIKVRTPIGISNIYHSETSYFKRDQSNNLWHVVSNEKSGASVDRFHYELIGKIRTNEEQIPLTLVSKEDSLFRIFKSDTFDNEFEINRSELRKDPMLLSELDQLKDDFVSITLSGTSLEFHYVFDLYAIEKVISAIRIIDHLQSRSNN